MKDTKSLIPILLLGIFLTLIFFQLNPGIVGYISMVFGIAIIYRIELQDHKSEL